jgi:hypothetical protein
MPRAQRRLNTVAQTVPSSTTARDHVPADHAPR